MVGSLNSQKISEKMWNEICCNKHWQRLDWRRACVKECFNRFNHSISIYDICYAFVFFILFMSGGRYFFFEFECVTCNLNFKKKNKVADTRISRQTMQAIMPPPYYVTHPSIYASIHHTYILQCPPVLISYISLPLTHSFTFCLWNIIKS